MPSSKERSHYQALCRDYTILLSLFQSQQSGNHPSHSCIYSHHQPWLQHARPHGRSLQQSAPYPTL
nr:hypothetical protein Iba_chr09bCG3870 [Ipomoea batatas]GMD31976.1 hypothetical protein Iba_chr09bCG3880 [Ipomoea batatas]